MSTYHYVYYRPSPQAIERGDYLGRPEDVLYDRTFEVSHSSDWYEKYVRQLYIEPRLNQLRAWGREAWVQTTPYPGAFY